MIISEINIICINSSHAVLPENNRLCCEVFNRKDNPYNRDYVFFKKLPGTWYNFFPNDNQYWDHSFFDFSYDCLNERYFVKEEKEYSGILLYLINFYLSLSPVKAIGLLLRIEDGEKGRVCFTTKSFFVELLREKQIEFNRIYIIIDEVQ